MECKSHYLQNNVVVIENVWRTVLPFGKNNEYCIVCELTAEFVAFLGDCRDWHCKVMVPSAAGTS